MRRLSLGRLSLLTGLTALAVSVGLPAHAASVLVFARHANVAGAVDGISAAKRPKPGLLLATGRSSRFPRAVFRSAPAGKKGLQGPAGRVGPAGRGGPVGAQGVRGLPGAAGAVGPDGLRGATGPEGLRGAPGAAGPTGPNGVLTPTRAGGALTGFFPNPLVAPGVVDQASVANGTIVPADLSSALSDGTAASLRTLGTGSLQAASGSDPRLADPRPPRGPAGGDLTGSYPSPTIQTEAVTAAGLGRNARLWASVSAAGELLRGHGVVDAAPAFQVGEYEIEFDRDIRGCVVAATVNAEAATRIVAVIDGRPRAFLFVLVRSLTDPNTLVPQPFSVRMFC